MLGFEYGVQVMWLIGFGEGLRSSQSKVLAFMIRKVYKEDGLS